jgi:hypothetical protein
MKLADKTVEVHSRGIQNENQFTIQQSAKMFNVLSNSLYSDKIGAVIRELCTNANDAHIAAKNPNPFHVYLPTEADANFKVRDFGTGLSKEDMEKLYTTYGASTKNTSNDFVGCLGLGSKSPFAYTKSFTSTSFFNGKQYTYIASIGDDGVPTLNLMHSCDTSEPNGLEISFAVKRYDYGEFSKKAVRVFHYLKQKPVVFGGYGINFNESYSNRNIFVSGNSWNVCSLNDNYNIFPNNHHNVGSNIIAIMGNIAYPVEISHLIGDVEKDTAEHIARWNQKANDNHTNYKSFLSNINNKNLYLEMEFSIGELEMDISREGLQYTKAVIKSLRAKTQEIYNTLRDEFTQKIAKCDTRIEAIQTFNKLRSVNDWGVGASWTCPKTQTVYNLNDSQDLSYNFSNNKTLYVFGYYYGGKRSRTKIALTSQIYKGTLGYNNWGGYTQSNVEFFYCDIKSLAQAKKILNQYSKQNDCYLYLIVDTADYTKSLDGVDELINDVGIEKFKKVSQYKHLISQIRKTRSKTGSVSNDDIFLICGDASDTECLTAKYGHAKYLKALTEDHIDSLEDMDEIVYIPISRYMSCEKYVGIDIVNRHYKDMKEILGVSNNIYAIKEKSVEKLKKDYNLIDFNDWIINIIKESSKNLDEYKVYIDAADKIRVSVDNSDDCQYAYYGNNSTEKQILYHIINIFGFEYRNYINNKIIVNYIDYLVMCDFFISQSNPIKIEACDLKIDQYYNLIDDILKIYKLDKISSKNIHSGIQKISRLKSLQDSLVYDQNSRTNIVDTSSDFIAINIKTIQKELKNELDKSPAFKYTMKETNPGDLSGVDYPRDYRNKWFSKINKDDSFKVAFGSLIN